MLLLHVIVFYHRSDSAHFLTALRHLVVELIIAIFARRVLAEQAASRETQPRHVIARPVC